MKAVMKVALGVGNIELRDIPEPTAGEGQVVIGVKAAGICGTDMHIYKDEFKSRPPVVLGHEISGEIVEVGQGVETLKTDMRVTTETYFHTCGVCRYCRNGQVNLCFERRSIGSAVNGGFTNYVVVPAKNIHELPEGLSFNAGSLTEPLACVVHGVLTTPTVAPGDLAVIAGPGAIGLLTLQVVKAAGAKTIVLGTSADESRLELAKTLGADCGIDVQEQNPEDLVRELSYQGLGADVVYECSGAGPAATQLLKLVRRKGRYVQIGLFGKSIAFDLDQLCYKELAMSGSNATIPSAWPKALQLLERGVVNTEALISDIYSVTDWQEAFDFFEAKQGIKLLLTPA